jgi:uncharacterized phage protein (TIGR01671 family)
VREIKFRGKQLHSEIWIYGDLTTVTPYVIDRFITFFTEDGSINRLSVDPSTVGQYTGLRDKNGKEIYEGDIIRWDEKEWGETYNEIVTWDYELFAIRKSDWKEYCEVAGNIYVNPKLSQKQKLEESTRK